MRTIRFSLLVAISTTSCSGSGVPAACRSSIAVVTSWKSRSAQIRSFRCVLSFSRKSGWRIISPNVVTGVEAGACIVIWRADANANIKDRLSFCEVFGINKS